MPLQEFWNDDPDLLWVYRDLYIEKKKEEAEELNYKCWLQGIYMCNAISSCFSKNAKYPNKPIEFNAKTKTKQEKNIELAQKIKEQAMRGQTLLQRSENKG